jgi:hypothetical protein
LPQGLPKKIKLHLLLSDLALQIGDPLPRLHQLDFRRIIWRRRPNWLPVSPARSP